MKAICFWFMSVVIFAATVTVNSQSLVVIADPTKEIPETKLSESESKLFQAALIRARKHVPSDICDQGEPEVAGVAYGAFSKKGAKQTLIFYQYCQTGNGLGWAGLVLIENGAIAENYLDDSGWTGDIVKIPDINQNGLDEFTLSYGGGMHQGQGGTGVDLMEFSGGKPKGIGWFQLEKYDETSAVVWQVTAKPGKTPIYYRQKFLSGEGNKYRRIGANQQFRLNKPYGSFMNVK